MKIKMLSRLLIDCPLYIYRSANLYTTKNANMYINTQCKYVYKQKYDYISSRRDKILRPLGCADESKPNANGYKGLQQPAHQYGHGSNGCAQRNSYSIRENKMKDIFSPLRPPESNCGCFSRIQQQVYFTCTRREVQMAQSNLCTKLWRSHCAQEMTKWNLQTVGPGCAALAGVGLRGPPRASSNTFAQRKGFFICCRALP